MSRFRVMMLITLALMVVSGQAQDPDSLEIIRLVNDARYQEGIPALFYNASLADAAQRHSDDMASAESLSHTGTDGSEFWERMQAAGYDLSTGAENVLYRFDTDPVAVYEQWRNSPPHQANMMNPAYVEIGVAYAQAESGAYYFTMVLGTREGVDPPPLPTVTPASLPTLTPTQTLIPPTMTPFTPPPTPEPVVVSPTMTPRQATPITPEPAQPVNPVAPSPTPAIPLPASSDPTVTVSETTTDTQLQQMIEQSLADFDAVFQSSGESAVIDPVTQTPVQVVSVPSQTPAPMNTAPPPTQQPADVRLEYNPDSFALLNISDAPLDLGGLVFTAGSRNLDIERWTLYMTQSIYAFPSGDCIQAWLASLNYEPSAPRDCTILRGWTVLYEDERVFWRDTEVFNVSREGVRLAVCEVSAGVCEFSLSDNLGAVPPQADSPVTSAPPAPETIASASGDIRLFITPEGVTLLNNSGVDLNLIDLRFESDNATLYASDWDIPQLSRPLSAFPDGGCLQVRGINLPDQPIPDACIHRHAYIIVGQTRQFWRDVTTFSVYRGNELLGTCETRTDRCDIRLP